MSADPVAVDYHFPAVTSVGSSEDGSHIIVEMPSGETVYRLAIAADEAGNLAAHILAAGADAARRRSGDGGQSKAVVPYSLSVVGSGPGQPMQLRVCLSRGSPPLVLAMTRSQLVEHARAILDTLASEELAAPSKSPARPDS